MAAAEALDGEAVKKLWMDRCRLLGDAAGDAGRLEGDATTESSSQPQSAHRVRVESTGSAHTAHVLAVAMRARKVVRAAKRLAQLIGAGPAAASARL